MFKIICFCILFAAVYGHRSKLETEGDMQSALMPQELNPAFVPGKDEPLRAILQLPRLRREATVIDTTTADSLVESPSTVAHTVKRWSRIVACIVLAVSATIEIVLYIIEAYST